MDFSRSPGGFRSRRSYPSLNHISLAPLTPRFPIDDDEGDLSPRVGEDGAGGDYFSPPHLNLDGDQLRTSYLSSYSVPGTPGVLSHSNSRSGSRVRHHQRSKSSGRINLSDTNLQGQGVTAGQPLHHHHHHHNHHAHFVGDKSKYRNTSLARRGNAAESTGRHDTEWMLRAGIALASSTREEKGQSWLAKRESSTNLVSEGQHGGDGAKPTRRSKSGRSTPAAHSRRGSRPVSRRNSRPDLAMTSFDMSSVALAKGMPGSSSGHRYSHSHGASPVDEGRHLVPDFVDERIRAEMESIQQEALEYSTSESDGSWDSEDEMDEQELQRLTRERGFGLGSWIDRMVEWTLFGVEDWPLLSSSDAAERPPKHVEITTEEPLAFSDHGGDTFEPGSMDIDDIASIVSDIEGSVVAEKPGELGGWQDAGWLFRTVKRLLI